MLSRKVSKKEFEEIKNTYENFIEAERNIQFARQVLKDVELDHLEKMSEEEILALIKNKRGDMDPALLLAFCRIIDHERKKKAH